MRISANGGTSPGLAGLAILALLAFAYAGADYLGHHYYAEYASARARAKSMDTDFEAMENDLKRAISFSQAPELYGAIGRLYFDKALTENTAGKAEKRDFYLDLAVAGYLELIKKNPIDALAYYDLGCAYMLYNFPLLTYAEQGRRYLRSAIKLDPSDEFLNVNVLYIYLTQWNSLSAAERAFLTGDLRDVLRYNPNFIRQVMSIWKRNFGGTDRLKEMLIGSDLWPQLQQFF